MCNLLLYESNWINLILYWIWISLKSLVYQYEMQLLSENPQKCRPFDFQDGRHYRGNEVMYKKNSSWFVWCFGEKKNWKLINKYWFYPTKSVHFQLFLVPYLFILSTKNVITFEPFDRFSKISVHCNPKRLLQIQLSRCYHFSHGIPTTGQLSAFIIQLVIWHVLP